MVRLFPSLPKALMEERARQIASTGGLEDLSTASAITTEEVFLLDVTAVVLASMVAAQLVSLPAQRAYGWYLRPRKKKASTPDEEEEPLDPEDTL
jgi:hypothetical protein